MKLVAIDMDGTLLSADKTISEKNKQVLKEAKQKGIKVVICTGRPLASIKKYLDELDLNDAGDYSITFNGGLVQKNDTGEVLQKHVLTGEDVAAIYSSIHGLDLPVDLISEGNVYHLLPEPANYPSIYQELNPAMNFLSVKLDEVPTTIPYNKMVVPTPADYLDSKIPLIPASINQNYSVVKSRDCLLEILNKEVSKGNALDFLGKYLDISQEEMMALGDEDNDISMIEYAGMGVAMENASEAVKKASNFVTQKNTEDGVAYAIEKFW